MSLRDYIRVFRRRWSIILACVLVAAGVTWLVSSDVDTSRQPTGFTATATLLVGAAPTPTGSPGQQIGGNLSLDPPMRSLGVTVSASLGSFVALCLGWVCRIRRCARLFHCGFLVVPVLGGWSARGEGGWAERCGVERVELVLPGPAGG